MITCHGHLGEGETQPKAEAGEANTEQGPPNSKLGTQSLMEAACKTRIREDGSDRTWTEQLRRLKPGPQCGVGSTISAQLTALGRDHRH